MTRVDLIAVDLDGTLLRSDSTLAVEGARALAAAAKRGVKVVIATTRTSDSVLRFAREIGAIGDTVLGDPLVCVNGAQIWASPDGPIWVTRHIVSDLAWALAEMADLLNWSLITTVGDVTYYRRRPDQKPGSLGPHRIVVERNVDALEAGDALRILNYDAEAMSAIEGFCEAHYPDQFHLESYYYPDGTPKSIGIYAPGSDKGTAMAFVLSRLGVDAAHVLVIGDNPNDLPMFRYAAIRVAMGNATAEVKQVATVTGPSNDEEGVAWAVKRYVLD